MFIKSEEILELKIKCKAIYGIQVVDSVQYSRPNSVNCSLAWFYTGKKTLIKLT